MRYTSGNLAETWRKFKIRLHYYFEDKYTKKLLTKDRKIEILITCLGEKGIDIHVFNLEQKPTSFDELIKLFDEYFHPRKNIVYERFVFNQIIQKSNERIDEFILSLKMQATSCEFLEHDNMIRDRLVPGVTDTELRRDLLRQSDLTLEIATKYCRAYESSHHQSAKMSIAPSTSYPLDTLRTHPSNNLAKVLPQTNRNIIRNNQTTYPASPSSSNTENIKMNSNKTSCFRCGGPYLRNHQCPASYWSRMSFLSFEKSLCICLSEEISTKYSRNPR